MWRERTEQGSAAETLEAQQAYLGECGQQRHGDRRERGALKECPLRAEWTNEAAALSVSKAPHACARRVQRAECSAPTLNIS